jgi:hypothetical protein
MKSSRQINQWLGYDGGWIQLPVQQYRLKVTRVKKLNNQWSIITSLPRCIKIITGLTIEHAVRQETITLQ